LMTPSPDAYTGIVRGAGGQQRSGVGGAYNL
jgi:hypothetical protein